MYDRPHVSSCHSFLFFFSSRRRHTRCSRDWSSDVCSSDLRFTPSAPAMATANVNFTANEDTGSRIVTGDGTDTIPPTLAITSPTGNAAYTTSNPLLTLGGTSSDNAGVTQVTWANDRSGGGTASGTTSWVASGIALQFGANVVTVTARDAAGNTATASLTVTLAGILPVTQDPLPAQDTDRER